MKYVFLLLLASCTSAQLRATLASVEVGYAQTRSDADVGGHVGTSALTGDAFRGDVNSEAWTTWVSFRPFAGLYMPEQEILEHIRPPPPKPRHAPIPYPLEPDPCARPNTSTSTSVQPVSPQ